MEAVLAASFAGCAKVVEGVEKFDLRGDVGLCKVATIVAPATVVPGARIVFIRALITDATARDISAVLGKQIEVVAIPREKWASKMESFGLAPGTTKAYEEAMDGLNSGWIHFGVPGTEHIASKATPAEVFEKARKVQNVSIDIVKLSSSITAQP